MLSPKDLLEIIDTMYPVIDELNAWITQDMIRRLMARLGRGEAAMLTASDVWQAEVYQAAGGHYDDLQDEIKKFTKLADKEIKAIFKDAGIKAWNNDDKFYTAKGYESVKLQQSERMINILTDLWERTENTMQNFTRTTASASQKRLINVLDNAHMRVITGAQSYNAAVKEAVNELINTQSKVEYSTGHTDTLETAVLRAVRTGVGQAAGNMAIQGMIERDWDLIRVSAHIGARYGDGGNNPSNHFYWQGGLYSRTGKTKEYPDFVETTGYGTGEGLCGWNCRHSFGPGDPDHNPYKNFDAEENKKAYDLSQKQRKAESQIRRCKNSILGVQEAIKNAEDEKLKQELQEEYGELALRLKNYNSIYNKFCEDNGLKKLSDRISVAKWNRSEASKASAAVRKRENLEKAEG
ncbi:MAG: phage minor capsid protein [Clostridia bacterium]|nr:phage minor capsid protein [Clostridia bacterium]